MEDFMTHLTVFNPFWLGGAVIFGFFLKLIFGKGFIFFVPLGYLAFILPTVYAEGYITHSSIGHEFLGMARDWNMSTFNATSLLVSLGFVLLSGVFWGLAGSRES